MPTPDAPDPHPFSDSDESPPPENEEQRPGLPADATVVSEETFTSPKGRRYRILKTDQMDPDDARLDGRDKEP